MANALDATGSGATGGCLCGAARYRLAKAPTAYGACHCAMCRRWTGGVEMGVWIEAGDLVWEADATVRTYRSSDWAERGFCATCGGALFWRLTAPGPMQGAMSLAFGSLDDICGLRFEREVYIDAKPESHAFAGDRPRLTEADILAQLAPGDAP